MSKLYASSSGLASLAGVEALTGVRYLYLDGNCLEEPELLRLLGERRSGVGGRMELPGPGSGRLLAGGLVGGEESAAAFADRWRRCAPPKPYPRLAALRPGQLEALDLTGNPGNTDALLQQLIEGGQVAGGVQCRGALVLVCRRRGRYPALKPRPPALPSRGRRPAQPGRVPQRAAAEGPGVRGLPADGSHLDRMEAALASRQQARSLERGLLPLQCSESVRPSLSVFFECSARSLLGCGISHPHCQSDLVSQEDTLPQLKLWTAQPLPPSRPVQTPQRRGWQSLRPS